MLICVHCTQQRLQMTVGARAVDKPMRHQQDRNVRRLASNIRRMSTSLSHPSNGKSSRLGT